MSEDSSVTLSVHLRLITNMYGLPNPLFLLEGALWPKNKWKQLCQVKVRTYHENILRTKALTNYKLDFLNIQAIGLNGFSHPALHNILTTQEVSMARPHLKMLTGDYQCLANIARDRGSNPQCRICPPSSAPPETITHILLQCTGTTDSRNRVWPELLNTVAAIFPNNQILSNVTSPEVATQFILDCTSLNLPNGYRIDICHPGAATIFQRARQYCYAVHSERTNKLKRLGLIT